VKLEKSRQYKGIKESRQLNKKPCSFQSKVFMKMKNGYYIITKQ